MIKFIAAITLLALPFSAQAFDTKAKQAILLDADTGAVLLAKEENTQMVPSSMSKLMTLYALFADIKAGKVKLDDTFTVSEKAWRKGGSKMFVEVGKRVKVEDLIRGIVVQSGNDACIVVAEGLKGTEEAFAKHLNAVGESIGLQHSNFVNATGWPDEGHLMSPSDLSKLAQRLMRDFPEFMPYFSETEFTYSGITQPNRNPLLGSNLGVNGLKTGHTEAAGFGIVLSAQSDGRALVAVINGTDTSRERKEEGEKLLRYGMNFYENVASAERGEAVGDVTVIDGKPNRITIQLAEDALVTIPKGKAGSVIADTILYSEPLIAPLPAGTVVGTYNVLLAGQVLREVPLVTTAEVPRAGFFKRKWDGLKRLVKGE